MGIVNYVDHASLNQIVASVESRLDKVGKEKGVTFDYADYYANAQADQTNLNQIGADLVADGVDVIVAVATPTAATMLAAVEDTDIPVVYSAVTDPAAAGFDASEHHRHLRRPEHRRHHEPHHWPSTPTSTPSACCTT